MSGSTHKHRYKNAALDSVELRRRREEEGVQLRKQKREQQLNKRRNVNVNQLLPEDNDQLQVRVLTTRSKSVCWFPAGKWHFVTHVPSYHSRDGAGTI